MKVLRPATESEVLLLRGEDYRVSDGFSAMLADEFKDGPTATEYGGGLDWFRVTNEEARAKFCRWMEGRVQCRAQPVIAMLRRGKKDYYYCRDHLYGRVFVDGFGENPDQLWTVVLVPDQPEEIRPAIAALIDRLRGVVLNPTEEALFRRHIDIASRSRLSR